MSDLISRKKAIEALDFEIVHMTVFSNDEKNGTNPLAQYNKGLEDGIKALKALPSAEPERKKGEWIDGLPYINSHWWVCSVCHVSAPENHTGYNFCPSCGADMRGE